LIENLVGKNNEGHLVGYRISNETSRGSGKRWIGKKYKGNLDLNLKGFYFYINTG
jgi:hypothetical protein